MQISIVIPVLNEARRLPLLLAALRRQFVDAELIVIDGGSVDGSAALALRGADTVLLGAPGRARQLNLGAAGARGEWLLFLHADSAPAFDADELAALVADAGPDAWGFFTITLQGRSRLLPVVAWFMNRRARFTHVATGDQGLLVRRDRFEALAGYANIPLMEDVEICKRLRRIAPPLPLHLVMRSSGRRWDEQGALRTVLSMWALRLAYWLGVPPRRLWQHYYGRRGISGAATTSAAPPR